MFLQMSRNMRIKFLSWYLGKCVIQTNPSKFDIRLFSEIEPDLDKNWFSWQICCAFHLWKMMSHHDVPISSNILLMANLPEVFTWSSCHFPLCSMHVSIRFCLIFIISFSPTNFVECPVWRMFLRPISGGAPYIRKRLVVWKFRVLTTRPNASKVGVFDNNNNLI